MPETDALAKRLKAYRKSNGMNQFEFASDVGISIEEVSLIERKLTDPRLSTLQKISAYMNVTVSDLLMVEDAKGDE